MIVEQGERELTQENTHAKKRETFQEMKVFEQGQHARYHIAIDACPSDHL